MKTFLVVAGLLMTGASVYGVVDYNKKAESKEFKELYKEAPVSDEIEVAKEESPVPMEEKREISKKEVVVRTEIPVKKSAKAKMAKKKKERVLRLKEFSRGKME